MKKRIFIILLLSFSCNLFFAQEIDFEIVKTYKNNEYLLYRNAEELDPYNESTGNRLFIDDDGNFYIFSYDKRIVYELKVSVNFHVLHRSRNLI